MGEWCYILASLTLVTIIHNVTYDFYFYNRGNFEIKGGDIMYRAIIELFKINTLKVKFGVVLRQDVVSPNVQIQPIISKFTIEGNDSLKIAPHPYVTLEICDDDRSYNSSITFNRYYLYLLIKTLKKCATQFINNKDLFFYMENKLIVSETSETFTASSASAKKIKIKPSVITDNTGKDYEAVILYINSMSSYTYLTYTELEYLINELNKIDMTQLSFECIKMATIQNTKNRGTKNEN